MPSQTPPRHASVDKRYQRRLKMEQKLFLRFITVLAFVIGLRTQCGDVFGCSCSGESVPQKPVLRGPDRAYLRKKVLFRCEIPGVPTPSTYQLLKGMGEPPEIVQTMDGDQPANFTLVVRSDSGGIYHCRVRTGTDPNSDPISSNYHHFQVVIPVRGARLVSDPDPPVVWEGAGLSLHCEVGAGSHLNYSWYFNRTELPRPSPPLGQTSLVINPVSQKHAGRYYCIVGNALEDRFSSSSPELEVQVKVFLSEPQISFSVAKEESGGYLAHVRCWSVRGSPPVWFWLVKGDRVLANQTTESLSAVFSLPVSIGRSLGVFRCRAGNHGNQELLSHPVTLEVVPVGGAVQMQQEYLYRADSEAVGVSLRCAVSHGTFPEYAWLLNDTLLPPGGASYIITPEGHTLILPIITAGNSGYYRCQARDSFDNGTWILSPVKLVQKTDLHLVSGEVLAVTFCCFLLLALAGISVWIFRRVDKRVQRRASSVVAATMSPSVLPSTS